MAYPVLTGAILVEANGAALNNAGQESGARVDNAIVVKQIRIGRLRFPYVSGQAWRRWWREVLYDECGWEPSPVTVINKPQQAFTAGNPILYAEDDLFGYMVARKKGSKGKRTAEASEENAEESAKQGTYRRVSPLKNSLLISVLPNVIERDFGHFTRNLPPDANPLLYEAEHYTTYLQGVFTISLSEVGHFELGEMSDLSEDTLNAHAGEVETIDSRTYRLPKNKRIQRVKDVLQALAHLRGGAHLARNLSDTSPIITLVGFLDGGNAPFQRLFVPDVNNERVVLNLERLRSIVQDYQDRMLAPSAGKALCFGYRPTVLANESEVLQAFADDPLLRQCIDVAGTPQQALEKIAAQVDPLFAQHNL